MYDDIYALIISFIRREERPYIRLALEECVAAGACIGGHAVVE